MGDLTESLARFSMIAVVASSVASGMGATGDADEATARPSYEPSRAAAMSTASDLGQAARYARPRNKGRARNTGNYWSRGHSVNSGNFTYVTHSTNANVAKSGSGNNANGPQKIAVQIR